MESELKSFENLTKEETIEFFLQCQRLLVNHHPQSEFIVRTDNLDKTAMFARWIKKYKGYVYQDANVCVLMNKIRVEDANDPVSVIKNSANQPPDPNYNAVSIDFVVFRRIEDCLRFCQTHYESRIAYVVFVKNSQPKIYKTEKFISRVLSIPIML